MLEFRKSPVPNLYEIIKEGSNLQYEFLGYLDWNQNEGKYFLTVGEDVPFYDLDELEQIVNKLKELNNA